MILVVVYINVLLYTCEHKVHILSFLYAINVFVWYYLRLYTREHISDQL